MEQVQSEQVVAVPNNHQVVNLLETLLEQAKKGEIRSFMAAIGGPTVPNKMGECFVIHSVDVVEMSRLARNLDAVRSSIPRGGKDHVFSRTNI